GRLHRRDGAEGGHALWRRMPGDDRGQLEGVALRDRWDVRVARDLPDADDGDLGAHRGRASMLGVSTRTSRLRSGRRNGAAAISNASPSRVVKPSAKESVAVPKKWTWMSPGRRNRACLKWWCARLARLWHMFASPDRNGFSH